MSEVILLFIWILVNFGISNGIAHSGLFYKWRIWFYKKTKSTLFHCVMCLAFWSGILTSLTWMSPTGVWYYDAFLSSATSWLIFLGIMSRQSTT